MRDLHTIDQEIALERVIWDHERRHQASNDYQAAARRIDALLDERSNVVSKMRDKSPRSVDAGILP